MKEHTNLKIKDEDVEDDDLMKTANALLNTKGGFIVVGVSTKGMITGVFLTDKQEQNFNAGCIKIVESLFPDAKRLIQGKCFTLNAKLSSDQQKSYLIVYKLTECELGSTFIINNDFPITLIKDGNRCLEVGRQRFYEVFAENILINDPDLAFCMKNTDKILNLFKNHFTNEVSKRSLEFQQVRDEYSIKQLSTANELLQSVKEKLAKLSYTVLKLICKRYHNRTEVIRDLCRSCYNKFIYRNKNK